jgi:transglutaminase-like putative cysteine protease
LPLHDVRQTIRNVNGSSFELVVTALRQPPAVMPAGVANPGKEYTESNFFLTSDDDLVKQHAREAVNGETDPWKKAQAIERWVNQNMKVQNFTEAMAPASEVARTLTGDCTEYSMLAAAMCKAVGIPSRTAIGLVYVDLLPPEKPLLGFHMWTEVFVRGQWVAIDATLGQGSVGPAHVKITDAHWHDTRAMTPLLPLMRVMISRPTVQIVEVK